MTALSERRTRLCDVDRHGGGDESPDFDAPSLPCPQTPANQVVDDGGQATE
ncbi:MAG TPA: hypothetical protein G4N94_10280 [Caldilineae bacterium]|nr:hypothetical protein [Caldilineae bacterium]